MQRPDEKKRQLIAATAARLFATRPFHKVTLDEVAAQARVGKGTVYIYFSSKEDLYFSLIYDGFAALVERMEGQLGSGVKLTPRATLRQIVAQLVEFAFAHPHFFELMRTAANQMKQPRWERRRRALMSLIERTIRRGNACGDMADPRPELTAVCVPGLVRSVILYAPRSLGVEAMTNHIVTLVERGIVPHSRHANAATAALPAATRRAGTGGSPDGKNCRARQNGIRRAATKKSRPNG